MSKNYLLKQLAQHMQADLADAIGAQEEEILRAIAKASENGTDSEEPVKFSVSLRGVLNLDANTVETAFSFATRTSVKAKHALEDPKQAKLPLEGVKKEFLPTKEQLVAPLDEALARAVSSRGAEMKNGPWSSVELDPEDKIRANVSATRESAGFKQGKGGVYRQEGAEVKNGPGTGFFPDPADKIRAKAAATIADAGFKQGADGVYREEAEE
jgi:hypothetical protein